MAKLSLERQVRPPAEIGINQHQRLRLPVRLQCQRRQRQRTMHALGGVVFGRAPVAAIDTDRGRDVFPGYADKSGKA